MPFANSRRYLFPGLTFHHTDFSETGFRNATLTLAQGNDVYLAGAVFTSCSLEKAVPEGEELVLTLMKTENTADH